MPTECVIGVDLGGTNLKAAVLDSGLRFRARATRVIAGLELPALLDAVAEIVAELGGGEAAAVGFGVAALFDEERAVAVSSTHLPLQGVPLAAMLAERIARPAFVDNDANLALLAEQRHGAAAGERCAVMVTLGTGVGGAVMVDGELLRGAQGAAGELGHLIVDPDGPPCGPGCPGHGCLESLVSGSALARDAGGVGGAVVTARARQGDAESIALLERLGGWLGIGLVSLVNIFDPDVIVVGGGVADAGELILAPARAVVAERALRYPGGHVAVRAARFGAAAGMVGAAVLAREAVAGRVAA